MPFAHSIPPNRGFIAFTSRIFLIATLAVSVIIPHSFQVPTAALIVVTGAIAIFGVRMTKWVSTQLIFYCAGAALTVFYLFIGNINGAPNDAIIQTALVYLASPLLWIIIAASLQQLFGRKGTVRWLILFTWGAMASVVVFFYAYFAFGRDSVEFLAEDANINVRGGFAGATMFVYGSLIFLSAAFFAEPSVVRSRLVRFVMPAALITAAATSGRSALILAIPIGYAVGLVLRSGLAPRYSTEGRNSIALLPTIGLLVAIALAGIILNALFAQLDLLYIGNVFLDKLLSGGGSERVEQTSALWDGIERSFGLGWGHGIGVDYIRNDRLPWRYEVLPLATVLRVGIIGLGIYALPFLSAAWVIVQRMRTRTLAPWDIYLAAGLASVTVATFTNPYLESFIFQWMCFIPIVIIGSIQNEAENESVDQDEIRAMAPRSIPQHA
ncbi:hypothetical protein [Qipengyuania spongiae]|uniref:O-antigen ligase domain-containing protein n=1 Tax=Qipengyuania spongiae TaxID=2909673 RepID=A0ABY5T342_9SPHN|nr:hypothetical protein [Qipengyuania spongiae]UVI40850.1 hypothetical protein L1F33_14425 [Qipengyuania spongiae]